MKIVDDINTKNSPSNNVYYHFLEKLLYMNGLRSKQPQSATASLAVRPTLDKSRLQ